MNLPKLQKLIQDIVESSHAEAGMLNDEELWLIRDSLNDCFAELKHLNLDKRVIIEIIDDWYDTRLNPKM